MHFSNSLLAAAGLLTIAFAAPISSDEGLVVLSGPVDAPAVVPRALIVERFTKSRTASPKKARTAKATTLKTSSTKSSTAKSTTTKTTTPKTSSTRSSTAKSTSAKTSSSKTTSVKTTSTKVASVVTTSTAVTKTSSKLASSTAVKIAATTSTPKGLQWLGVNESGAEFGAGNLPGTLGTDYTWPSTSAIQTLMGKGMNIFRIPILMERIAQGSMTATLDATYLASLTTVVNYITAAGKHAVIDAQNFGRYKGSVFTSTSDFQTFWTHVATAFKSNANVIFDCNNEFHDEPTATIVAELNQACINGIRAAGATTQYIFVEGTSWTGAWTWTTSGNSVNMGGLTDPSNKIVYEMHQYLDSDGSGTSETCVSSTIGAERIAAATLWLRANGKKGVLGEFAGGANSVCQTAITGLLDALVAGSDVWMGGMFWAAGPWWGDYMFSMEPSTGKGYTAYMNTLAKYAPS